MSPENEDNGAIKSATKIGDTFFLEVERVFTPDGNQYSIYQAGSKKTNGIDRTLEQLKQRGVLFDGSGESILLDHDIIHGVQYTLDGESQFDSFSEVIFLKGNVGITPIHDVFLSLSPEAPYEPSPYDHQTPDEEH